MSFVGCSATSGGSGLGGGGGGSGGQTDGGGGTSASGGTSGSSGTSGTGGFGAFDAGGGLGGSSGSGGLQDGGECTGSTTKSTQLPLDIYLMMDISGSMTDTTSGGQTKWAAVKTAMTTFLNDPSSQGLGVGIQYFPIKDPKVPSSCTASSQCVGGGICVLKTCNGTGVVIPCNTTADCGPGEGSCVALGQDCTNPQQLCAPGTNNCTGLGGCKKLTTSYCTNEESCTLGDYATPAVDITTLGSPQPIINSINAQSPAGLTPTAPALQGAIKHATDWATAHPNHKVVVVLATDGLPTECDPTAISDVAKIAATGASGTPAVDTFVIGVFSPTDNQPPTNAQQNVDTIASAGGTKQAFIVDTTGNVGQQFTDALNAIRGQALACEFSLPDPPEGGALDFGKVNVSFSSNGQTNNVYYVGDKSKCDPNTGGWYYDVDPASGATPTKIIVCDSTCTAFKAASSGTASAQVDVKLGCVTQTKPPA